jgi:hypothetical protein
VTFDTDVNNVANRLAPKDEGGLVKLDQFGGKTVKLLE